MIPSLSLSLVPSNSALKLGCKSSPKASFKGARTKGLLTFLL